MFTVKSIQAKLNDQTFLHPGSWQPDYGLFKRSVYFRGELLHIDVSEIKHSKWYQKQPHYRPVGKATYEVQIIEYIDNTSPPSRFDTVKCDKLADVTLILNAYDLEEF